MNQKLTIFFVFCFLLCLSALTKAQDCSNNNCADAQILTNGLNGPFTNDCATSTASDPSTPSNCFDDAFDNTLWFHIMGTGGSINITSTIVNCTGIQLPMSDNQLVVYEDSCDGNLITCNDDINPEMGNFLAGVEFTSTAGTDYYIVVDGYDGELGGFCLDVTIEGGNEAIPCVDFIRGDTPDGGGPFGSISTLPCGDVCGNPLSTTFAVYSNEAYHMTDLRAGNQYQLSICEGDGAGSWSPVLTIAEYNTESEIVGDVITFIADCSIDFSVPTDGAYILIITEVGKCDGATPNEIDNGTITVSCLATNPCLGEEDLCESNVCANAIEIDASTANSHGPYNNFCSTPADLPDVPANCFFGNDSFTNPLWFSFQGTGNNVSIHTITNCDNLNAPIGDTQMAVYQMNCTGELVACDDDGGLNLLSAISINTNANTTYYLVVDGYNGEMGEFCLEVQASPNCSVGTTAATPSSSVEGAGTMTDPYKVCPSQSVALSSQDNFSVDGDLTFSNAGIVWGLYTAQPTNINPFDDPNFVENGFLIGTDGVIFNNGTVLFDGQTFDFGTYVIVPMLNENVPKISIAALCTGIDLSGTYPVFQFLPANDGLCQDCPTDIWIDTKITGCDSILLDPNISGASSYDWSTGEETASITVNEQGTYTVAIELENGCMLNDEIRVSIAKSITADFEYTVTEDMRVLFSNTSMNAAEYMWDFGDGTSSTSESPTHSYDESGSYDVVLTAINENCPPSEITQTVVVFTTGIELLFPHLQLYPNPSSDWLHIDLGKTIGQSYKILIFNTLGQEIYHQMANQQKHQINLSHVQKGIYFIQLVFENGVTVHEKWMIK